MDDATAAKGSWDAAQEAENARKAIQWIESLTREVEIGSLYLGKVTRIMGFGAFVEILPGKEGLVRIGELADYHVPTVEDVVSVGDEVMVVVTEVDRQGRVNLSRKAAMPIAREMLDKLTGQDPNSAYTTTLEVERQINTFFRLESPTVIAKLREAFPICPRSPTNARCP